MSLIGCVFYFFLIKYFLAFSILFILVSDYLKETVIRSFTLEQLFGYPVQKIIISNRIIKIYFDIIEVKEKIF